MDILLSESNLPKYYIDITGTECYYCNSDIITNEEFTSVRCSNPQCIRIIAGSLDKIRDGMGITGYAVTSLLGLCQTYGWTSQISPFENTNHIFKEEFEGKIREVRTLSDAISLLAIPNMNIKAKNIFQDYTTFLDFSLDCNQSGGIFEVISRYLGSGKDCDNMTQTISDNWDTLSKIDEVFDLKSKEAPVKMQYAEICISESIINPDTIEVFKNSLGYYGKITKEVYVSLMNQILFKYGLQLTLKSSYSSSVFMVINDTGSETSKVRQAKSSGKLCNSYQALQVFINYLKGKQDNAE